jgi:hypothetical protein
MVQYRAPQRVAGESVAHCRARGAARRGTFRRGADSVELGGAGRAVSRALSVSYDPGGAYLAA